MAGWPPPLLPAEHGSGPHRHSSSAHHALAGGPRRLILLTHPEPLPLHHIRGLDQRQWMIRIHDKLLLRRHTVLNPETVKSEAVRTARSYVGSSQSRNRLGLPRLSRFSLFVP